MYLKLSPEIIPLATIVHFICHIVRQTIYKNNALIISQEKSLSRVVGRMNMLYSPAVSSLRFVKG